MKSKNQHGNIGILYFYLIIFHTMFFQGAYYLPGLLTLNIAFLLYFLFSKKTISLDLSLLGFLFIFFMALLSGLFLSINHSVGINELLKYSLFPLSYGVFASYEDKEALGKVFYRSFLFLMVFGLLAWLGLSIMPGMVTIQSNRLQSFLQYANTTALFMAIGLLLSIDQYLNFKKKYFLLFASLFGIALFLTQSRTTFVFFLFISVLYLFRFLKKRGKLILISTIFISLFASTLSGARIARIALTEPTLIERVITFYDGIHVLLQNPLGLGLGNWQYMQFQYQSAPYQVRYIHNLYLQMALDAGILVALLFIGILFFYFLKNIQSKSVHFFIFLLILLQSFFEVGFNYGILILYFTYVLTRLKQADYRLKLHPKLKYLSILPLVLLIVFFASGSYRPSEDYFNRAKVENKSSKALKLLEEGYEQNPYDFQILLSLAEGYLYGEDLEKAYFYANELLRIFPYHKAHQQLVFRVLQKGHDLGAFSKVEYEAKKEDLEARIAVYDEKIHPLYRYIDDQMDY